MTDADRTPEEIAEDFEIPYERNTTCILEDQVNLAEFNRCFAAALRAYGDARAVAEREWAASVASAGHCGNRGQSCLWIEEAIRRGPQP